MSTYIRDFASELGPLGLCLRLRRLGERMAQDARRLYAELGLDIEPGWHAVFLLLNQHPDGLGVSRIARELGITHPSASILVKQMAQRGYLEQAQHPVDGRKRIISLSAKACGELPELRKVWNACEQSMRDVIESAGGDVFRVVEGLERSMKAQSMDERAMSRLVSEPLGN